MSYTRDMDHYTRGIGAIQAIDKVKSRRRARLELERRRALARTDAKKVHLMGLGAINLSPIKVRTAKDTTIDGGGGGLLPPPGNIPSPQPGGRGGPSTYVPPASALRAGMSQLVSRGLPPPPPGPRGLPPGSPGIMVDPGPNVLVPPTNGGGGGTSGGGSINAGGDATGGSSGGGGGGGGGGATVGPSGGPGDPGDTTPAPNLDLESAGGIQAFVEAHKMPLILAALAVGAYAYSKRKKKAA